MKRQKRTKHEDLDRIDILILKTLQQNGRISWVDLAEKIHLSASPCLERVKRLEQKGFIRGYTAILDEHLLGFSEIAFVYLSLKDMQRARIRDFRRNIATMGSVVECYAITGDYDFFLKIQFGDLNQMRSIISSLQGLPNVVRCNSSIAVEKLESKVAVRLPFD
ncbi:MAG: Lrp/AsnC family transcriptional regulator [Pseudomonadota bacterium]